MSTIRLIIQDPKNWIAHNISWLRWPILAAVLFFIALLSLVLNGRIALFFLVLLVALPALLLGAYVLLRWMALGFIILMVVNMVVPFEIGTGSGTSLNATILLIVAMTGLWIFDMINNQRRIRLQHGQHGKSEINMMYNSWLRLYKVGIDVTLYLLFHYLGLIKIQ